MVDWRRSGLWRRKIQRWWRLVNFLGRWDGDVAGWRRLNWSPGGWWRSWSPGCWSSGRRRWRLTGDAGVGASIITTKTRSRTVKISNSGTPTVGSLSFTLCRSLGSHWRTFWILDELETGATTQEQG